MYLGNLLSMFPGTTIIKGIFQKVGSVTINVRHSLGIRDGNVVWCWNESVQSWEDFNGPAAPGTLHRTYQSGHEYPIFDGLDGLQDNDDILHSGGFATMRISQLSLVLETCGGASCQKSRHRLAAQLQLQRREPQQLILVSRIAHGVGVS